MEKNNAVVTWGLGGTLGWGVVIILLNVIAQTLMVFFYAHRLDIELTDEQFDALTNDGTSLYWATFAGLFTVLLSTWCIIALKAQSNFRRYLALHWLPLKTLLVWLGLVLIFIAATDALTYLLGKPIVVEFMTESYQTADHKVLLVLALVVAAPVLEEVLFRGFLFSGLVNSRVGIVGASLITSMAWALMHIQYDWYGITTIFVSGLLLAAARVKTNSLVAPILMHALMNTVATIETVVYLG